MKYLLKSFLPVTLINEILLIFITLGLPDRVPTHLNFGMEIDRFGSRWTVVILGAIPVVFSIGLLIYQHTTRNNEITSKNRKAENILFAIIVAFLTIITWLPALLATLRNIDIGSKIDLPIEFIVVFPLGVIIVITSNFMGIIKQNHWLGIRTPWTLMNEAVWKKTHRLGGYTGVIAGILMCVLSVIGFICKSYVLSIIGLFLGIVLISIVPTVYSYIIYKKEAIR